MNRKKDTSYRYPYNTSRNGLRILLLIGLFIHNGSAQTDSSFVKQLEVTVYLETYYSYDFSNPGNHSKPSFFYAYNRHNEVNLNLGFIKAAYSNNSIRANLALMTGTYSNANLVSEPGVLKNIFEANSGIRLSNRKSIWLDAGIFPSHIGFESAIGKDCWNLTRSILAENSPYYESGVRFSYTTDDGRWYFSMLAINGWQRIQRVDGNNTLAFGHQLTFKPNEHITLNSSSFIGNDKPDTVKQTRMFHNFYGIFQISHKLAATIGFDIGMEEAPGGRNNQNIWFSPVLIVRLATSDKFNIALRGEYYNDAEGVIISTGTPNGFQTYGYSINVDHIIADNVMWRTELRGLKSQDEIFIMDSQPSTKNYCITTAITIAL